MPAQGKYMVKQWDYSQEGTTVAFYTDVANAGNIAAITALNAALLTAIQDLTLGNVAQETFVATIDDNGANYPSDVNAQRERKWKLNMVDSVTGEKVTATIGCADLSGGHLQAGSDLANMAHADWVALKAAIDGNYNNPETGNSLILQSAQKVGRNT